MRTYRQSSPNLFGPRTDSEGWAHLADGLRGPVQTQRDSIRMLDTNELERLSLRTRKAVARLVVGELVLVIWVFEEPLPRLRHDHPRHVRDFAKAGGRLAKTDRLDAQVLAHFGLAIRPRARPLPDAETQALEAQLARRRQVVTMITAEKNRLGTATKPVHKGIQRHIAWLEKDLTKLDDGLGDTIRQRGLWRMVSPASAKSCR